jgi:peptide-methionine (S)-S-oxide reductase
MIAFARIAMVSVATLAAFACKPTSASPTTTMEQPANPNQPAADPEQPAPKPEVPTNAQVATLGTGCFWCTEAIFQQIPGVFSATSGYMGGHKENPTYQEVCEETTGHAEVIQVVFDPTKITYPELLEWFWQAHDPTTLNRQGADVGTQYRSAIFFHTPEQQTAAIAARDKAQKDFPSPIVTEITQASTFYPAENYHQDYYFLNKNKNGYCNAVITPKLEKLKLKH